MTHAHTNKNNNNNTWFTNFVEINHLKASTAEGRGAYRILIGRPEGRRPGRRPRHRWEDNIKMDRQGKGCGGMDWLELAQDRERWPALVNAVRNLWVP
jgi:hypothetical protein